MKITNESTKNVEMELNSKDDIQIGKKEFEKSSETICMVVKKIGILQVSSLMLGEVELARRVKVGDELTVWEIPKDCARHLIDEETMVLKAINDGPWTGGGGPG